MNVLLVAAKGHSSRVPQKNFRPFYNEKSLVDIAVELISSFTADNVLKIVSSDLDRYETSCDDIVFHHRPKNLACVETPILDVLKHIVTSFNLSVNDKIFLLQPTSPFRSLTHLNSFYNLVCDSTLASVSAFSTYQVVDAHPGRMYYDVSGSLHPAEKSLIDKQSQELPPCFHRNGCFYAFSVCDIMNSSLYSPNVINYVMPYSSSINIDTITDFHIASNVYPLFLSGTIDNLPPVSL